MKVIIEIKQSATLIRIAELGRRLNDLNELFLDVIADIHKEA